jgi:hypothetical protein
VGGGGAAGFSLCGFARSMPRIGAPIRKCCNQQKRALNGANNGPDGGWFPAFVLLESAPLHGLKSPLQNVPLSNRQHMVWLCQGAKSRINTEQNTSKAYQANSRVIWSASEDDRGDPAAR